VEYAEAENHYEIQAETTSDSRSGQQAREDTWPERPFQCTSMTDNEPSAMLKLPTGDMSNTRTTAVDRYGIQSGLGMAAGRSTTGNREIYFQTKEDAGLEYYRLDPMDNV